MRTSVLLPLLRSQTQGDLLALLYLHPEEEFSLSEISRITGKTLKNIQQEASRLVATGFLKDRRRGRLRLLSAVTDSVVAKPLTDLLAVTYGPIPVLSDTLGGVSGVEAVYIYGSWAARYRGELGNIPNDVDVLVIGSADPDDLDEIAREAERRLFREVNIRRVRPRTWRDPSPTDPFLATVRSRPLVRVWPPETAPEGAQHALAAGTHRDRSDD